MKLIALAVPSLARARRRNYFSFVPVLLPPTPQASSAKLIAWKISHRNKAGATFIKAVIIEKWRQKMSRARPRQGKQTAFEKFPCRARAI